MQKKDRRGTDSFQATSSEERNERVECPTCACSFGSIGGRNKHYGLCHEGSIALVDVECEGCGGSFPVPKRIAGRRRFCLRECYNEMRSAD